MEKIRDKDEFKPGRILYHYEGLNYNQIKEFTVMKKPCFDKKTLSHGIWWVTVKWSDTGLPHFKVPIKADSCNVFWCSLHVRCII